MEKSLLRGGLLDYNVAVENLPAEQVELATNGSGDRINPFD
jgi:hypothetical protein